MPDQNSSKRSTSVGIRPDHSPAVGQIEADQIETGHLKRLLTTREVKALTGATERQLQYWDERGLTRPEIRKSRNPIFGFRFYDEIDVRRVQTIVRLSETRGHTTKWKQGTRRLTTIGRIPKAAIQCRYLFFSPRLKLIAASDDRAELIRVATASAHGVLLVELPAFAKAGASHG